MNIVTLLERLGNGLLAAELNFFEHPDRLDDLEQTAVRLSQMTVRDFMGMTLTEADSLICGCMKRKDGYNIARHDERTLISTAGDIRFTHTLFTRRDKTGSCYLLDDLMHLPAKERFTPLAEAKVLSEAEVHSYQHAADSLSIANQKVTKTAVMDKVHAIEKELVADRFEPVIIKRCCSYLYIEADEDHIHKQENGTEKGCMLGKLVYIFEGKEDDGNGRRRLINVHYISGIYQGSDGNKELWQQVQKYIETHYDTDFLKRVYISGDGAPWIKAGTEYVDKSVFVADRYHLMNYINTVARCTLDERDITKGRFYKYIYKKNQLAVKKLLTRIQNHCEGSDNAVESCRSFIIGNWDAILRAYHDKNVLGCSAEGHVSHVLSERMSSRPMAWSETGADRMCRFRCYVRNYGREKIIDLVQYRREKAFEAQKHLSTGTDGMMEDVPVHTYRSSYQQRFGKYFDTMQASIGGLTVKKTLAIRERLYEI